MCTLLGPPHTPLLLAVSCTLAASAATLRRYIILPQNVTHFVAKYLLTRSSPIRTPVHAHALLDSGKKLLCAERHM